MPRKIIPKKRGQVSRGGGSIIIVPHSLQQANNLTHAPTTNAMKAVRIVPDNG
jgi:hypothetical protein